MYSRIVLAELVLVPEDVILQGEELHRRVLLHLQRVLVLLHEFHSVQLNEHKKQDNSYHAVCISDSSSPNILHQNVPIDKEIKSSRSSNYQKIKSPNILLHQLHFNYNSIT